MSARRALLAAAALSLLSAAAAAAPRKDRPVNPATGQMLPWHELEDIEKDFWAIAEKIRPDLQKLKDIQVEYEKPPNHKDMVRRREAVRAALIEQQGPLEELNDSYRETQKRINMQAVTIGFAFAMKGGDLTKSDYEIQSAMAAQEAYRQISEFTREVRNTLLNDDHDFQKAEIARNQRRLIYAIAGAIALALLATLLISLWVSRRRDATIQAVPTGYPAYSGSSGAPLSGPVRPQPLSGPVGAPLSGPVQQGGCAGLPAPTSPAGAASGVIGQNFKVERELGRGGMGIVYEAMDLTLQRKVAIKRMREEVLQSPKELDMFLAEARLVAQLRHPNLVEIHSFFREGGQVYLVFEYVSGKSLHALLEDSVKLTPAQSRDVVRQAGAALDYAHSKKVIHRDLKPSNIVITEDDTVKIMDFGIAHQAKKTVAKLTKAEAWGTPPYMAPEQELGTVSRESDLYSLAVCWYEMMTGKVPFEGPNYLAQKREMVYRPPTQTAPGLPAEVDEVARRALQPDPKKRFHSAAEFTAAVEAAVA